MNIHRELNSVFAALANPTRLAIVAMLAQGEMTVMEIVKPLGVSQPAVSRELRVLEAAGLIERQADGTKRRCRLRVEAFNELESWLAMMRNVMEQNYARLDKVLDAMKERGETDE